MFGRKKKTQNELAEESSRNIFTPGIYHGSEDPAYLEMVKSVDIATIVDLVRRRAQRDGQWCIDNDLVGDNEDKMRKMMAYVIDRGNIMRNVAYQINGETNMNIDFVCRDLANGSRWVG